MAKQLLDIWCALVVFLEVTDNGFEAGFTLPLVEFSDYRLGQSIDIWYESSIPRPNGDAAARRQKKADTRLVLNEYLLQEIQLSQWVKRHHRPPSFIVFVVSLVPIHMAILGRGPSGLLSFIGCISRTPVFFLHNP
jgi:hypothetical protein